MIQLQMYLLNSDKITSKELNL